MKTLIASLLLLVSSASLFAQGPILRNVLTTNAQSVVTNIVQSMIPGGGGATNAVATVLSNGVAFGTLMTSLGVSNTDSITWGGFSNSSIGTLTATYTGNTNTTGNPGVVSGRGIGTNLSVVTNIATQAATVATNSLAGQLGAVYATDAELVSATNAATLASSVNATNAGNLAFKPANNAFTGSNNFAGNTTFGLPPLGNGAGLTNAVDIIAGTSVTVVTGANNRSFTISATASGAAVPHTNEVFGYGANTNLGLLVTTQLLITGTSPGSFLTIGEANSRSNTIISISGSNDLHFRAGRETNNFASSNSIFTVYDTSVFARPANFVSTATGTTFTVTSIEIGNATDTTITRFGAGVIAVEGVQVVDLSTLQTLSSKQISGPLTLLEGGSVALDPAASADGVYSGVTVTGTAGATLAFGDLIVLDVTDSRWELADANAASGADGDSRGMIGICVLAAAGDASPTTILLQGIVRGDAVFPTFTVNAPLYVSETAGDITATSPTTEDNVVRILGAAMTADSLYFAPDRVWVVYDVP